MEKIKELNLEDFKNFIYENEEKYEIRRRKN